MCVFGGSKVPDPKMPTERSAMRAPDNAAITDSAARRATDRLRAGSSTVLTSGSGVTMAAPAAGKTLLGQ